MHGVPTNLNLDRFNGATITPTSLAGPLLAALPLLAVRAVLPLWLALPFAFLVSGLFGFLIDVLVLRPLRKRDAPHLIPMIATTTSTSTIGPTFRAAAAPVRSLPAVASMQIRGSRSA